MILLNRIDFIKNFFLIFIVSYSIVLFTKIIFLFYLYESFNSYTISELIYAILWGYRFDFSVSAIIALLSTFFDFKKKFFIVLASILTNLLFLLQISDIMYFYDSSRHIGYELSDALTGCF